MPTLIVIPLLSGLHWRAVVIEINYNNIDVKIIWDDPFGQFPKYLKELV